MSEENIENILKNWKYLFEQMYKNEKSDSFRNIFREVYGDDYPEEVNPDGFVTITDLENIINNIKVGPGDRFIDLGCGRGGPGLWIAKKTQADYVGIDLSENAIRKAKQRLKEFEISFNAEFKAGNICALDFLDNSFEGAISIDVLSFLPELPKAISEIARVLRNNSNFVFTTWERTSKTNPKNYKKLLSNSGFDIKIYEEISDWKSRQQKVYEKTLERKKL
jgi:ubiquinone/menaquinone biosynthesis C-methylase UbiE